MRTEDLDQVTEKLVIEAILRIRVRRARALVETPEEKADRLYRRALETPMRRAQIAVSTIPRVRFSEIRRRDSEIPEGMSPDDWVLLTANTFKHPYVLSPEGAAASAYRQQGAAIEQSPIFQGALRAGRKHLDLLRPLMSQLPNAARRGFEERERQMTRGLPEQLWPRGTVGRPWRNPDPRPEIEKIARSILALRNRNDPQELEDLLQREIGLRSEDLGRLLNLELERMAATVARRVLACRRKPEMRGDVRALSAASHNLQVEIGRRNGRERSSRIPFAERIPDRIKVFTYVRNGGNSNRNPASLLPRPPRPLRQDPAD